MKKAEGIGYIKNDLSIIKVELRPDGSCEKIDSVTYDTPSECEHNYNMLEGVEVADMWPVQTRKEASQLGQSKYYTGRNCKYDHISQRYVSSGLCISCISARSRGFKRNVDSARDGLIPVNAMVHPDDAPTVQAVINNMNKARGL